MTVKEALKITETIDLSKLEISGNAKYIANWGRAIETLREKQIPKEPRFYNCNYYCPDCDDLVVCHDLIMRWDNKFCKACGKAIKWDWNYKEKNMEFRCFNGTTNCDYCGSCHAEFQVRTSDEQRRIYNKALEDFERKMSSFCFGLKASEGNLCRVDVIENELQRVKRQLKR